MSDTVLKRPIHGGNIAWAAEIAGCSPSLILDFSASISPLGAPESAIAAILSEVEQLRFYPNPAYPDLCAALSHCHQIPSEWILPGNGSAELLTWACRDLSQLRTTHLIVPAFGDYFRALNTFAASVTLEPLNLDSVELPASLFQSMSADGLLLNNPHNPTGFQFLRTDLLPLLDRFATIVVDEAFMDFLPPDQQQSLVSEVQRFPNLVILRSLTKFYSLPGLRIGYAIAHPDRLARWRQWRDPWSVNALASAAAIAAVQDTQFQQQTWQWLGQARSQLLSGLEALPGLRPFPGAANYLLVQSDLSVPQLQQALLQRCQILIRDCLSFPELGDRYFRVAVRTEPENQRLIDGLAEILSEWNDARRL